MRIKTHKELMATDGIIIECGGWYANTNGSNSIDKDIIKDYEGRTDLVVGHNSYIDKNGETDSWMLEGWMLTEVEGSYTVAHVDKENNEVTLTSNEPATELVLVDKYLCMTGDNDTPCNYDIHVYHKKDNPTHIIIKFYYAFNSRWSIPGELAFAYDWGNGKVIDSGKYDMKIWDYVLIAQFCDKFINKSDLYFKNNKYFKEVK
jgi:hypothetical protein